MQALSPKNQEPALLNAICKELDPAENCTYCVTTFTTDMASRDADVRVRMFAHGLGIPEDPATGSANGALGAYLVKYGVFTNAINGKITIQSEQGIEMGRPSQIQIEVTGNTKDISLVRVGGSVVPLIQGTMSW